MENKEDYKHKGIQLNPAKMDGKGTTQTKTDQHRPIHFILYRRISIVANKVIKRK